MHQIDVQFLCPLWCCVIPSSFEFVDLQKCVLLFYVLFVVGNVTQILSVLLW